MPVHQVRNVGLRDPKNIRDFPLFQLLFLQDLENVKSNLRPSHKLVGTFKSEVREDVSGPLFKINSSSSFRTHWPAPVPVRIASGSDRHPASGLRRLSSISSERRAKHRSAYQSGALRPLGKHPMRIGAISMTPLPTPLKGLAS